MATTLTSKGQVTVPKKLRDYLGVGPGSAVEFELSATGQVLLRPLKTGKARILSRFAKLRGTATVRMTTEEIMAMTRGDV